MGIPSFNSMNRNSPQPHNLLWESSSRRRVSESYHRYRDNDRRNSSPIHDNIQEDNRHRYSYPVYYQERSPPQPDHHQRTQESSPSWFQSTYQSVRAIAENIIMVPSGLTSMPSPPVDPRNVSDDRIYPNDASAGKHVIHPQYETTLDGDIVIVQPSFDDHEVNKSPTSPSPVKRSNQDWQVRSPQQDREEIKDEANERNPSSPPRQDTALTERRHIRNLSAHFYDATSLVDTPDIYKEDNDSKTPSGGDDLSLGSASGRKHRRMFSGDLCNPNLAHRRIDSIGNSAVVNRQYPQQHHREHSAGLDILSAAVLEDMTKDELAAAAGHGYSARQHNPSLRPSWEPQSATHHHYLSYSQGHPLSGPPPYSHRGIDNPHMYPPQKNAPPALPPLASLSQHPYRAPSHHLYPSTTNYPLHMYQHHHQSLAPPHHHQGMPPHHPTAALLFYPPTYQARGPPQPDSFHSPYPAQHYTESSRAFQQQNRKPEQPVSNMKAPTHGPPTLSSLADNAWTSTSLNPISASHKGSQTFVTAIAVGNGSKTIRATSRLKNAATNTENAPTADSSDGVPSHILGHHHHRKLSSFSSIGLGTIFGGTVLSPGAPDTPPTHNPFHPLKSALATVPEGKPHHRSISSVSFLNVLDSVGHENDVFLRNLQESAPEYRSPATSVKEESKSTSPLNNTVEATGSASDCSSENEESKLAVGGTSKRVRRKCTISGCRNRVVQGGLCIAHGAKRKTCKYPGCKKNVKKAGLCSTHGPARKKCDAPNCLKVAVQGGRCIAHGAKKKLCCVPNCNKQAILGGMCKKHHDKSKGETESGNVDDPSALEYCQEVASEVPRRTEKHKPNHTRGLSIFHDISADAVSSLLNSEAKNVTDNVETPLRSIPEKPGSATEVVTRAMW